MGEQKPKYWTIYLDMDGVVADLLPSIIELLYDESAVTPILRGWPKGTYDLSEALGKSEEQIWAAIRGEGANFWRDLKPFPWASSLVRRLNEMGDVLFLSSPSRDAPSATGKLQWIGDNFPMMAQEYILAPKQHKWRLAGPTSVLIDDSQDNVDDWIQHGGVGILFPTQQNDGVWEYGEDLRADEMMAIVEKAMNEHGGKNGELKEKE